MTKSLPDIQTEVRELSGQVKKISAALERLFSDIDALKEQDAPELDFEKIEQASHRFSFGVHPLHSLQDGYVCRRYIETLIGVIHTDTDSKAMKARLIFVQWIVTQADIDMTLRDLLHSSMQITENDIAELPAQLSPQLRENLIVDALLTAYIRGSALAQTMQYIALLAGVLEIDEKTLRTLTMIAKVVLTQSDRGLRKQDYGDLLAGYDQFKQYFGKPLREKYASKARSKNASAQRLLGDMLKKAYATGPQSKDLAAQRQIIYKAHSPTLWKVENETLVRNGQTIGVQYTRWGAVAVTAPCNGKLFLFTLDNTYYGVIASPDDNLESIKAWVKWEKE